MDSYYKTLGGEKSAEYCTRNVAVSYVPLASVDQHHMYGSFQNLLQAPIGVFPAQEQVGQNVPVNFTFNNRPTSISQSSSGTILPGETGSSGTESVPGDSSNTIEIADLSVDGATSLPYEENNGAPSKQSATVPFIGTDSSGFQMPSSKPSETSSRDHTEIAVQTDITEMSNQQTHTVVSADKSQDLVNDSPKSKIDDEEAEKQSHSEDSLESLAKKLLQEIQNDIEQQTCSTSKNMMEVMLSIYHVISSQLKINVTSSVEHQDTVTKELDATVNIDVDNSDQPEDVIPNTSITHVDSKGTCATEFEPVDTSAKNGKKSNYKKRTVSHQKKFTRQKKARHTSVQKMEKVEKTLQDEDKTGDSKTDGMAFTDDSNEIKVEEPFSDDEIDDSSNLVITESDTCNNKISSVEESAYNMTTVKRKRGRPKKESKIKKKVNEEPSPIWTKESRFGINRNLRLHSYHKKCPVVPTDLDTDFYSPSENGYYCPDCKFIFHKKNKLLVHKKLKAGDKCVSDCIFCDAEEHKEVFQCLKCPKVFETKELLERHVVKHLTEVFNCNFCNLSFYTIPDLKFHMQQEHGEEIQQTFLCDLCGSKFKEKKILNAHRKYVHTNERPEACPTCGRKFKTKSQLKNHLVTHMSPAELDLSCEVCGKMFTRVATLKDHVRRHKKEFTFFCEVCHKGFYRKHGLEEHMRVHTGDKPYNCKFCEFKCALSCNLVKHMRIHQKQQQA